MDGKTWFANTYILCMNAFLYGMASSSLDLQQRREREREVGGGWGWERGRERKSEVGGERETKKERGVEGHESFIHFQAKETESETVGKD